MNSRVFFLIVCIVFCPLLNGAQSAAAHASSASGTATAAPASDGLDIPAAHDEDHLSAAVTPSTGTGTLERKATAALRTFTPPSTAAVRRGSSSHSPFPTPTAVASSAAAPNQSGGPAPVPAGAFRAPRSKPTSADLLINPALAHLAYASLGKVVAAHRALQAAEKKAAADEKNGEPAHKQNGSTRSSTRSARPPQQLIDTASSINDNTGTRRDGMKYLDEVRAKTKSESAAAAIYHDGVSPAVGTPTGETLRHSLTSKIKHAQQTARLQQMQEKNTVLTPATFAAAAATQAVSAAQSATIICTLTGALTEEDLEKYRCQFDPPTLPAPRAVPAPISIPPSPGGGRFYKDADFEAYDPQAVRLQQPSPRFCAEYEEYKQRKAAEAAVQSSSATATTNVSSGTSSTYTATTVTVLNPSESSALTPTHSTTSSTQADATRGAACAPTDTPQAQQDALRVSAAAITRGNASTLHRPAPIVAPQPQRTSAQRTPAIRRPITPESPVSPSSSSLEGFIYEIAKILF